MGILSRAPSLIAQVDGILAIELKWLGLFLFPMQMKPTFSAAAPRRRPRTGRAQAVPIVDALASNDAFAHLRAGVARLRALEDDLGACLPDYLRTNVAATSAHDGVLNLLTPHSALAARLRHLEPKMIAYLRERGWAVDTMKVRIRPIAQKPEPGPKMARISATGLACLDALRAGLEPSPLRDSLERMVARHRGG